MDEVINKRRRFYQWLETPRYDREPRTMSLLAVELGVHPNTLSHWAKEKKAADDIGRKLHGDIDDLDDDTKAEILAQAMFKAGRHGNQSAAKLWYQMKGRLVEKSEHKVSFDAGDITREILKSERELGAGGTGVDKVQEGFALLPEKLLSDTGQGEEIDS